MKVTVIGGGPAGLYFSLLLKKADPAHEVVVLERNKPDDTFGWGVVFSDATLENLAAADPETHQSHHRSTSRTGTTSTSTSGAAPSHPAATASAASRASSCCTSCRSAHGRWAWSCAFECEVSESTICATGRTFRPAGRRRRQQQPGPARVRRSLPARSRHAQRTLHLAGHDTATRRVHVHLHRERARRLPGARVPLRSRSSRRSSSSVMSSPGATPGGTG